MEAGKSAKRPGLISMEYTALNSSMQLMSPYGGIIYVFLESDASFDMTINGAIEMPYFEDYVNCHPQEKSPWLTITC